MTNVGVPYVVYSSSWLHPTFRSVEFREQSFLQPVRLYVVGRLERRRRLRRVSDMFLGDAEVRV